MGRGRRVQLAVVPALLWVAVGSAALHLPPVVVYGIAGLVAFVVWVVTGAIADRRSGRRP
jgi:hypothetical protein